MKKGLVKKSWCFAIIVLFVGASSITNITANIEKETSQILSFDDPPDEEWQRLYGGPMDDRVYNLTKTKGGGYILTGYTKSYGAGGIDIWLIKTDKNGKEIWNKTFGGAMDDYGFSVIQTVDEGYALLGDTWSYGSGDGDIILIKTDADGNELWNETYGGIEYDGGRCLLQTEDGDFLLLGWTDSKGAGSRDIWLIKTNSSGNITWDKTYGGVNYDRGWCIKPTSDGKYAIIGEAYSYGGRQIYLNNVFENGTLDWFQTYGSQSSGYWGQQTSDGGFIIIGETQNYGAGGWDYQLIKTDGDGNEEWMETYGGTANDYGYYVSQTDDGGYILNGWSHSQGPGGEMWVIKTNETGNTTWDLTYGGDGMDEGRSVQQTKYGGYIIMGWTNSYGPGGSDAWLIKLEGKEPDLICNGDLSWGDVKGGTTVTGSFNVSNIGDSGSELDWIITEWPDWGTWTFDPQEGDDLASGGSVTVDVSVLAPKRVSVAAIRLGKLDEEFTGQVKIVNKENNSDFCTIDVSMVVPINHQINNYPLLQKILELFPNAFPVLRYMLGL